MYYIMILILSLSLNVIQATGQVITGDDFDLLYVEAKKQIDSSCAKCGPTKSLDEFLQGIAKLEKVISSSKSKQTIHMALELLGDSYGQLQHSFFSGQPDKQKEYGQKRRKAYEQIMQDNTCPHPKIILKLYAYNKTTAKKLAALKPILELQSTFFQAKYIEGSLLLEDGNTIEGLEALELAISLAKFRDAHYYAYGLAEIMKEHGKMDLAYKIMKKKYGNKLDNKAINEMLNEK